MQLIEDTEAVSPACEGARRPFLHVRNVSKSFAGNLVLDRAELTLGRGEVHALVGANGSGKSTLIKVLTGYHAPEAGAEAWVDGVPSRFTRHGPVPESGAGLTIKALHQDLGLIPRLSVADNAGMVTGYASGRGGRIHWQDQQRRTRELLATVGLTGIDVRRPVADCDPLQRTQVALARALAGWTSDEGLLILDEPTATLPEDQVQRLFDIIRSISERGITVLYVSHRLGEIFAVAHRVTALREGRVVGHSEVHALDRRSLVDLMMGPAAAATEQVSRRHRTPTTGRPVVLAVRDLRAPTVHGVDFDLREGEALGFAGLVGSGLQELPYLLTGALRADRGKIAVRGTMFEARRLSPLRAKALGIGLVPADRKQQSLLPTRPVAENIVLPRIAAFEVRRWLRRRRERTYAAGWIRRLEIVPRDPDKAVGLLSGGNQQKVVVAKWLGVAESALILAEPTAGVDILAKERIYDEIRQQCARGLPVIVCSTDITDLVRVCDRVIALDAGVPVAEFVGADISEDAILRQILHSSTGGRGETE